MGGTRPPNKAKPFVNCVISKRILLHVQDNTIEPTGSSICEKTTRIPEQKIPQIDGFSSVNDNMTGFECKFIPVVIGNRPDKISVTQDYRLRVRKTIVRNNKALIASHLPIFTLYNIWSARSKLVNIIQDRDKLLFF